MAINNAMEASEIVRQFLSQMGWSTLIKPLKAEKNNAHWVVEFQVGFKDMRFEIDAGTGEIVRYGTL